MQSTDWNWDHLRHFLALAEHRTLSAAARQLSVSHSTVLRHIRAFELALHTRLFEHTTTGYILTSAGRELHVQANQMKVTLDSVARDISGADNTVAGEVIITTTDSLAFHVLPPMLQKLSDLYPALRLSLQMRNQRLSVENREADIAIRACQNPPDTLIGRCIGSVEFSACASIGYIEQRKLTSFPGLLPKALSESTNVTADPHQFIVLDASYSGVPFYDWLTTRIPAEARVLEVNNFLLAAAMCRAGLGITVLPTYMLEPSSNLQVLPTSQPIDNNSLWVLCHSDLRYSEKIRRVRQFLFDEMSEYLSVPQSFQKDNALSVHR